MKILTLDFETYYSSTYSLSKVTTEEYVRDEQFEVIGVAVQEDDGEPVWFSGTHDEVHQFLLGYNFADNLALAHNAMFDAAILTWVFGIQPKGWLDTLSMARALHGTEVGGSLATLAEHYRLGQKGTEVLNALGKRRIDFNPHDLAKYGEYCCNDAALTYKLFQHLADGFPKSELRLIDLTIRMFSEPKLRLNVGLLRKHLEQVRAKKDEMLNRALIDKEQLMSNPQLALLLREMGIEPPMKISPTTGKETYAFSKTDEEFKALLEHENPIIQAIVAARLGVKSTLEETRTERFISIAERGPLPVPLRYYAAHTGRWGGDDKLNLQNLPRNSPLKRAIVAPVGYVICDSDSSQIEARTLAWLAEQDDLVDAFTNGEDVYKIMASAIYNKAETTITKDERFVGKTTILGCFGADTKVLTTGGWKRIVDVHGTDMVWDGETWVAHAGVVPKGERETIQAWGVAATPEHEILTEHGWREWQEVTTNPSLSRSAFDRARSLSLSGSGTSNPWGNLRGGTPLSAVTAVGREKLTDKTSRWVVQPGAIRVLRARLIRLAKSIGVTNLSSLTWSIVSAFSPASHRVLAAATTRTQRSTRTMVGVASSYMNLGAQTAQRFCSFLLGCPVGMTPSAILTGLTTARATNPVTYGLQPEVRTPGIREKSENCKRKLQTYDIAYAGPNNRFMIATDAGPLIVHNCGYGMGATKFRAQLKNFNVVIETDEAQRIINTYRDTYPSIPKLWRKSQEVLDWIANDQAGEFGRGGLLKVDGKQGIRLPNGLYLKYPNLRKRDDPETGKTEYVYDTKKGKTTVPNRIYGGKVVENVCQALARIAIGEQILLVAKKYPVVMTVHDAIACLIPKDEAETGKEYVEMCMRIRPQWASELPLNCEAGYGESYGEC